MRRPFLAIFFMHVMLCGIISAFPSNNHLERGGSSINLQSRDEHLVDANFGHASDKSKKDLFRRGRGRGQKPGAQCDGTFYKQSKVEEVAAKACKKANGGGFGSIRHTLPKLFQTSPRQFTGSATLFPYEHPDGLTMMRITNSFFPFSKISRFLKLGGDDYVIFSGQCRSVGIVRNTGRNQFILCRATIGTTVFTSPGAPHSY